MTAGRTKPGKWGAVALSAASIANGVLNATILAISARQGQTEQIAAFTVVVALLALVSIATGGGSTFLYVTGTEGEREAVRSQRLLVVLPALIAATVIAGFWYTTRGYEWAAILLSGVVVVGNNLGELQYGDLTRQARFYHSAMVSPLSKIPAIALVLVDAPLTVALSVAVLVQFCANEVLLRRSAAWLRKSSLRSISYKSAISAFFMGRQLFAYSLVELFNGRAATIFLSFFVTPRVMGSFGAILSVYQAFGTVFYSALQVPMAARARRRHGIGGFGRVEARSEGLAVAAVFAFSMALYVAAPWAVIEGLNLVSQDSVEWLRIFAIALPCYLVNRAVAMYFIGVGQYRYATRAVLPITLTMAILLVVLLPALGAMGAALSTLLAELLAAALLSSWLIFKYLKRRTLRRSSRVEEMSLSERG